VPLLRHFKSSRLDKISAQKWSNPDGALGAYKTARTIMAQRSQRRKSACTVTASWHACEWFSPRDQAKIEVEIPDCRQKEQSFSEKIIRTDPVFSATNERMNTVQQRHLCCRRAAMILDTCRGPEDFCRILPANVHLRENYVFNTLA